MRALWTTKAIIPLHLTPPGLSLSSAHAEDAPITAPGQTTAPETNLAARPRTPRAGTHTRRRYAAAIAISFGLAAMTAPPPVMAQVNHNEHGGLLPDLEPPPISGVPSSTLWERSPKAPPTPWSLSERIAWLHKAIARDTARLGAGKVPDSKRHWVEEQIDDYNQELHDLQYGYY